MNEKELIEACIRKEQTAYNQLFSNYAPKMLMVCVRYMSDEEEAKDVLQNGFVKVFKSIRSFRFGGSFEGWIKKIMINEALEALRQRKKFIVENSDVYETSADLVDDSEENITNNNFTQEELLQVLKTLPDPFGVVFNMYCFEKYSHKEIAKILSIKTETSRSRLTRARKILREKLMKLATKKEKLNENG